MEWWAGSFWDLEVESVGELLKFNGVDKAGVWKDSTLKPEDDASKGELGMAEAGTAGEMVDRGFRAGAGVIRL